MRKRLPRRWAGVVLATIGSQAIIALKSALDPQLCVPAFRLVCPAVFICDICLIHARPSVLQINLYQFDLLRYSIILYKIR